MGPRGSHAQTASTHGGRRRSATNKRGHIVEPKKKKKAAHHDPLTKRSTCVDIRDAVVDVHEDRSAVLDEYLLEEHPRNLARFDIGVWHEMPFWSVVAGPAETQAFLVRSTGLDEDVALPRDFGFYSSAESLVWMSTIIGTRNAMATCSDGLAQLGLDIFWEVFLNKEFNGHAIGILEYRLTGY